MRGDTKRNLRSAVALRSNHVGYGPITTELVHHSEMT
jgi:hypothetical protein